jgi:hypothetical protein
MKPLKRITTREITSEEWAYVAGILDGEGCISSQVTPHGRYKVRLSVTQGRREIVDFLATLFTGTTSHRSVLKSGYQRWTWVAGRRYLIEAILEGARPYLRLKGDQADVALWMLRHETNHPQAARHHNQLRKLKRPNG